MTDEYVTEFNWDSVDVEGSPDYVARERVVRCVDCKYSVFHPLSASTKMICELFDNQIMNRDDFCSRGKRYGDD